jgi:glutamate carboxypeptidase
MADPHVIDAMLADLRVLVECESPSSDLEAVARSAHLVATVGTRLLGSSPETLVIEGCTHLRWRFGAGERVLLLGHHDTVWPLGSLAEHPFRVEDGRAYGPGCFDMKAGLVQLFHAVAALPDPDGITIVVNGDEELGSLSSRGLVEDEARDIGVALVLEASGEGGALKTARKGVAVYDVSVFGKAAHAGLEPHVGVNATVGVADVVLALAALDEGHDSNSVTPTTLSSGTATNTVPARADLRVDVRTMSQDEQQRLDAAVKAVSTTLPGARVEVRNRTWRPPLDPAASRELFALAARVAEDLKLPALLAVHVGGGSDGNLAAGVGARVLDGLGALGAGAHAPGEHVVVAAMPERSRLLSGLLARLLDEDYVALLKGEAR